MPQAPPAPGGYPQQQDNTQVDNDGYAPDRGVARISFMNGNVSVRRGDSGELVAAILNAPLTIGDRLVTAEGSRTEVQLDYANLVRLGPATEVRFSELREGHYQIQIATGTTTFRVLRDTTAQIEISTPSISVRPLKRGVYRITVRPDGTSEITVRGGDAEVFGPRGSEQIHSGSTMLVRGSSNDPEFQVVGAYPEDEFDRWGASRDQQMERSTAPNHVSRDVYGTEDLDPYGRWVNDGSYGQVWVPAADPGWAPYRCGRWVYMDYYGWTWVGCEPWAWAPYHYGRWYFGTFGWAWWPGPIYSRYYWRPALVGFFGWGGGVGIGVGFGFGHVGWVPLAPYERFHPWYGAGFRGPTVVNNVSVTNIYRNARVNNGVTSIQAAQFGRTSINNTNFVRASASDLSRAGMVRGNLPVGPSAESRQFSTRQASTQGLPRTNENTRFFSRTPAAPATSGASPAAGGWRRAESPASGSSSGGWQRFNPSANGGARPSAQTTPQNGNGGWQRLDGANRGNTAAAPQIPTRTYATEPRAPQQVRISPPIVQNRGSSGGGGSRGSSGGGSHPSGGGGGSHGGSGSSGSHGGGRR